MVDFRKMMLERMSEDRRNAFLFWEEQYKKDKTKFETKTDHELIIFFLYYWMNSDFHRKYTDHNHDITGSTYDSVMIKVVIPELLIRFMKMTGYINDETVISEEPFRHLENLANLDLNKYMRSRSQE